MHDDFEEPFHNHAVKKLAIQRHSLHASDGCLCVDNICQLYFAAGAGRLATIKLIEPLSAIKPDPDAAKFLLLDH